MAINYNADCTNTNTIQTSSSESSFLFLWSEFFWIALISNLVVSLKCGALFRENTKQPKFDIRLRFKEIAHKKKRKEAYSYSVMSEVLWEREVLLQQKFPLQRVILSAKGYYWWCTDISGSGNIISFKSLLLHYLFRIRKIVFLLRILFLIAY